MATSAYASAAEQLSPSGYSKVWSHLYSTPPANADVLVETVDFQTATVFGVVIGGVSGMVNKMQQEAQSHGSQMYGLALYHRKINPIQVTIPTQVCITIPIFGNVCIPIPGGGATIFATDEYRLVGVHSQFQWAVFAIGLAIAFGIVMFVVMNLHNEQGVFKNIANDFATAFGGGQAGAITKEFIIFAIAAGAFSIGAYILLRDITQSTGLSATSVRVPGTPSIPQLQNPNPGVQFQTPYGAVGVTPQRGVSLSTDLGMRARGQQAAQARAAMQAQARAAQQQADQQRRQAAFEADQRRRQASAALAESRARQAAAKEAAEAA